MSFSDRMRYYRTAIGMTQADLANRLGVSQKAISSWETGRTDPNLGQVAEMCRIFDCQIDQLTETRSRKIGEISIEDILVRIGTATMNEVLTIQEAANLRLEYITEVSEAMREKKKLEQQMADMQKRIDDLERTNQARLNGYPRSNK